MDDWRLNGQEEYLSNITLYKITFPDFWETAYRNKNTFYQKIAHYAERFVAETNRGTEYLEDEKIQHLWHDHCEFCWDKVTTDTECEFYSTEDWHHWICKECFNDFKDKFHWTVKQIEK